MMRMIMAGLDVLKREAVIKFVIFVTKKARASGPFLYAIRLFFNNSVQLFCLDDLPIQA